MQNYNLPTTNENNTYSGVSFILPEQSIYDLTGATISLAVARTPTSAPTRTFSIGDGITVTLPYTIVFAPDPVNIKNGNYAWDMTITFSDNRVKTYIGGSWKILPIISD